ncbi:hypothetical protein B0H11DRAFT_2282249 [Mycena galericulata]|nr:hypothetical protein B0H11DRAFT_2282249 [Mycena galericulata]
MSPPVCSSSAIIRLFSGLPQATIPPRSGGGGGGDPLPKSFLCALNAERARADFRKRANGVRTATLLTEGRMVGTGGVGEGRNGKAETTIRSGETLTHFNNHGDAAYGRTDANRIFQFRFLMRPLVHSAVQASLTTTRAECKKVLAFSPSSSTSLPITSAPSASKSPAALNAKAKSKPHPNQNRAAADAPHDAPQMPQDKHAHRPKEFVQTSSGAPRRLNDIVLAPPDLFVTGMARRTSTQITNTMNGVGKGGAGVSGKDGNRKSTNPPPPSLLSRAQALQLAAARADAVRRFREVGGGWVTGRG